jgi:precorrin-8X/cobalt-precorrin-8 methylmutase
MQFITDPQAIEAKSMKLIAPYLTALKLTPQAIKVYSRIIHAAGDPDYARLIKMHEFAVKAATKALGQGGNIYCDVEMVRTGINRSRLAEYGGQVHCLISDSGVAQEAKRLGITRAMAAMRAFGEKINGAVVAIGNAPTALFEVLRLVKEEGLRPAAIIGVPVGFVGAAEAKAQLMAESPVPYITVTGNKGGSPIAAAAVNALLYML